MPALNPLWVVGYAAELLFSFWPVLLLALMWRGRGLEAMLSAWFLFLLSWILRLLWVPGPLLRLLPEPLNTSLFFLTGILLVAAAVWRIVRERRPPRMTPDTAATPEDLLKLSKDQLEQMVATLYQRRGYQPKRTGLIREPGVDVVVYTPRGQKWIVQCKRTRGAVGAHAVRDLYAALRGAKADRGILVTTGTFTLEAQAWARGKQIALVDGKALLYSWKEPRRD